MATRRGRERLRVFFFATEVAVLLSRPPVLRAEVIPTSLATGREVGVVRPEEGGVPAGRETEVALGEASEQADKLSEAFSSARVLFSTRSEGPARAFAALWSVDDSGLAVPAALKRALSR